MQRAPGWIRLAGIALELAALGFVAYVLMDREAAALPPVRPAAKPPPETGTAIVPPEEQPTSERVFSEPIEFIRETADEGARYFRALDTEVELLAGFYSDGRMRLASGHRRFAGMVENGRADLLDLDNNQWSEVLVHETPSGRMQLELRGGPYDAHVLTCEQLL